MAHYKSVYKYISKIKNTPRLAHVPIQFQVIGGSVRFSGCDGLTIPKSRAAYRDDGKEGKTVPKLFSRGVSKYLILALV